LDPRDTLAPNNLAWFLTTYADVSFHDPARAVGLAKRAVDLALGDGNLWNTLGVAHYRAGNWKAAVESLTRAADLEEGGTAFDFFFLAMAHWKLGATDEARKWYDRAIEWMDKNAKGNDELRRFRSEAEELLAIKRK
jgi:tetratricopeptide (TPR) repeat protein